MVLDQCIDWHSLIPIPAFSAVSEAFSDTGVGIGTALVQIYEEIDDRLKSQENGQMI